LGFDKKKRKESRKVKPVAAKSKIQREITPQRNNNKKLKKRKRKKKTAKKKS